MQEKKLCKQGKDFLLGDQAGNHSLMFRFYTTVGNELMGQLFMRRQPLKRFHEKTATEVV
jgi:hypothetical protein